MFVDGLTVGDILIGPALNATPRKCENATPERGFANLIKCDTRFNYMRHQVFPAFRAFFNEMRHQIFT